MPRVRSALTDSRRFFLIVVLVAIGVKLFLMSGFRIVAAFAPHDSSNFLDHARALAVGHWFGVYNNLTLIKQPFYPIYLALVEESSLPLNVANILLDALAAVVACRAIRPLVSSWTWLAGIFLVLCYNPFSFDVLEHVLYRSHINPALALLSVSTAFGILVRRRRPIGVTIPWLIAFGVSFTAFWLTREEAAWLIPCLAVICGAYFWWAFRNRSGQLQWRASSLLLPLAIFVVGVGSIMAINYRLYGWAVTNEQQAPEFISAYNSVTRITVPKPRYVPLPHSARALAYAVSPAARELEPTFEGADGKAWATTTCSYTPTLCAGHEIGGGWAEWAFRDAVAGAGHYDSGADARAFYVRMAAEIDAACDAKRLPCGPKSRSVFPPPIDRADIPAIFVEFVRGFRIMLTQETWRYGVPGALPAPLNLRLDYDFVVRSVYDSGSYHRMTGWIIYDQSKAPAIAGDGSTGAKFIVEPSPDLAPALKDLKGFASRDFQNARFEITSDCEESCVLIVPGAQGKLVTIPLTIGVIDVRVPGVVYHVDLNRRVREFGASAKDRILTEIAHAYQAFFALGLFLCWGLCAARIVRGVSRRRLRLPDHAVLAVAVLLSTSFLILLLAIINVVAFLGAFNEEYMGAMNPLLLFSASVTISFEAAIIYRFMRRRFIHQRG